MTAGPAFLDMREFPIVGRVFVLKLHKLECEVQALSCGTTHLHVMYQSRAVDAFEELGKAKQFSSLKLRRPSGKLWGEGGKIVRINDAPHAARCFEYICAHATKEGAFIWRYDRDARPTRDSLEEVIAAARGNT